MDYTFIIGKMIEEYRKNKPIYQHMRNYFDGKHDIYTNGKFKIRPGSSDRPTHCNWISKFISEEIAYGLNQPLTFKSKSDNKQIVADVLAAMEHFKLNHDQKLMKDLEIYGLCYAVYYFDKKGRFCERILSPLDGIAYTDEEGKAVLFIHFFNKKYDTADYYNVYFPDGHIDQYKDDVLIGSVDTGFSFCPVTVVQMEEAETIYAKIRNLNDDYNELLSNQQALISEYKNAYMTICAENQSVTEGVVNALRDENAGIITYPTAGGKPEWLIKNINDTAIRNQLQEIKENLYAQSGHIDFNEKLSSNLSGVALQSRLTGLDQRVNSVLNVVIDAIYDRIYAICWDLQRKRSKDYNATDIRIESNVDIPMDVNSRVNEAVQLSNIVSLKTRLERLPFIENADAEIERLAQEQKNNKKLASTKLNDAFYGGASA